MTEIEIHVRVSSMRHVNIALLFYSGRGPNLVVMEGDGPDRHYPVDASEAESILEEISQARPESIPPNVASIDGVMYSLRIEAGENCVEWTWMNEVPAVWISLGRVADRLIALATPRLEGPLIEGP